PRPDPPLGHGPNPPHDIRTHEDHETRHADIARRNVDVSSAELRSSALDRRREGVEIRRQEGAAEEGGRDGRDLLQAEDEDVGRAAGGVGAGEGGEERAGEGGRVDRAAGTVVGQDVERQGRHWAVGRAVVFVGGAWSRR
ncbi:hypothetical protein LTR16_007674, partial [Cryomyces antarcticus]